MRKSLFWLFVLSVSVSIQCCGSDDGGTESPEFGEVDTQLVIASLDSMKNEVFAIMAQHKPNNTDAYYTVDTDIAGDLSGKAALHGADTVSVSEHDGIQSTDKHGTFRAPLDAYSNLKDVLLSKEGTIKYKASYQRRGTVTADTEVFTFESPALEVTLVKDGKQIKNILEIKFMYQYIRKTDNNVETSYLESRRHTVKRSDGTTYSF